MGAFLISWIMDNYGVGVADGIKYRAAINRPYETVPTSLNVGADIIRPLHY